jgi:hypothetical protein
MTSNYGHAARAWALRAFVVLVPAILMARAPAAPPDPAAAPSPPAAPAHTAAECEDLLKQFDVAWPSHRDAKLADEAQQSRDQGEAACKAHHYADPSRPARHRRQAGEDRRSRPDLSASSAGAADFSG